MKAWHVTSDPNAVQGCDPSIRGPCSNLDLHDIDSRVTKDMPWKLSQAKAQINRLSTHYRKRYRPGRQGYHRSQPASPLLATMATTLCLMATLTSSVALGTSALTTAVVATGTKKALQHLHSCNHQKQKVQLPLTKTTPAHTRYCPARCSTAQQGDSRPHHCMDSTTRTLARPLD